MKNSIYFLMMFIGLALTSCEPMEDIHDAVDKDLASMPVVGVNEYTLTEDDYKVLDLNFGNFSSMDDAKALIPQLLSDKFPVWGEGSLALVTFDLYSPLVVKKQTVTAAGYEAVGLDVNYFTAFSQIEDYLEYKFPDVKEGTFVELTYDVLAEEIPYTFTNDDFDLIGEELGDVYPDAAPSAANYNNFDRREGKDAYWSNEMILDAINVVLSEEFDDITGQTYNVSYAIFDGSSGTQSMNVRFDGNAYVAAGGTAYDVSNDDFDLIGVEFATVYPKPAASAAQYNNFERRSSNAAYWSTEMIVEALNFLLHEQYPDATEGAKFDVTYRVYTGSSGSEVISLVLSDGEYIIDEEASISTIVQTTAYAFIDNNWRLPVTIQPEDYTSMGQRFPNFDNKEDAIFKLETFLELEFPYAEEGDIIPVEFEIYVGGGKTETNYANFRFEGGEFHHIPNVIEQTLQFGHDGITWVPDNTVTYTLTAADYAFISEEFSETYPDPSWSVGRYNNFDRRPGNRNQWTDAMILEAMSALLNEKVAPNAEEGQKYLLSFAIYNGTNTIEQLALIKTDGVWVPL